MAAVTIWSAKSPPKSLFPLFRHLFHVPPPTIYLFSYFNSFSEFNYAFHFLSLIRPPAASLILLSPYELKVKGKSRRIYSCHMSRISQIWKAQLMVPLTTYRNTWTSWNWWEKNLFHCDLQSGWGSINSENSVNSRRCSLLLPLLVTYVHWLIMCCNILSGEVMPYHRWQENGERTRVAGPE